MRVLLVTRWLLATAGCSALRYAVHSLRLRGGLLNARLSPDDTLAVHVRDCDSGVGVTCSKHNVVIHIRPGSAAENAGLNLGDRILAVDGTALHGRKLSEVIQRASEHTFDLRRSLREAEVEVREAVSKGKGAFAAEPLDEGVFVGTYIGTLTTQEQTNQRYDIQGGEQADYLFRLDASRGIDAQNSTHFSRYFNHHQHGNLQPVQDVDGARIAFYAKRDIEVGEELTFDYGPRYWIGREPPSADTDSRNFSEAVQERPPSLSLLYPPTVGTVLPLTPLTPLELQSALALPESESRRALLRCLDFFGARRINKRDELEGHQFEVGEMLEIPCGVREGAPRKLICSASLEGAAVACIVDAILDPTDSSGALSREFEGWVQSMRDDLCLVRRWRDRVPGFASARHDAIAAAAYLLWKCPTPGPALSREACNEICLTLQDEPGEDGASRALLVLERYAQHEHLHGLVDQLEQWFYIGAGSTVVMQRPSPELSGAVPQDLGVHWDRAARLVEFGLLTYNDDGKGTFHPPSRSKEDNWLIEID